MLLLLLSLPLASLPQSVANQASLSVQNQRSAHPCEEDPLNSGIISYAPNGWPGVEEQVATPPRSSHWSLGPPLPLSSWASPPPSPHLVYSLLFPRVGSGAAIPPLQTNGSSPDGGGGGRAGANCGGESDLGERGKGWGGVGKPSGAKRTRPIPGKHLHERGHQKSQKVLRKTKKKERDKRAS